MFYIKFIKSFFLIIAINLIYYVFAEIGDMDVAKPVSSDDNEGPQFIRSNNSSSITNLDSHPNLDLLPNISGENRCSFYMGKDKNAGGYGKESDIGEFPFMALLQYKNYTKRGIKCPGTLINKNYVLTAAHCIKSNLISVRLGEHNLITDKDCDEDEKYCLDPVQDILIEKIVVHNYSSKTKLNDIALIRLKKSANITANNVKPICLPKTDTLRNNPSKATVAGWGETEFGELSPVISKVQVNVNGERVKCQNNYKKTYNIDIPDEYICATYVENYDNCLYGGPLFDKRTLSYVQYGIFSNGPRIPCGIEHDIGGDLYVNVSHYMKWILDHLEP